MHTGPHMLRRFGFLVLLLAGCGVPSGVSGEAPASAPSSGPLLVDLRLSPVALTPPFSPEVADYSAALGDRDVVELTVVVAPGVHLELDGLPSAEKRALFVPGAGRVVVVKATLGERTEERFVTLTRTSAMREAGQLAPAKVAPPPEEPLEVSGGRGFGHPVLSDNGRFAAVSFLDEQFRAHTLEVLRLDGPTLERVALYDDGVVPTRFCERANCLWAEDHRFGPNGEDRFVLLRLTWNERGAVAAESWTVAPDTSARILSPDEPAELIEYTPTGASTRRLLAEGRFGPPSGLPSLTWGVQTRGHALSADGRWLAHGDHRGGQPASSTRGARPPGEVALFHRSDSGSWTLVQRLSSPTPKEESYGHAMLFSADGRVLFVGVGAADLDELQNAGLIERYQRSGEAFTLSHTIVSPSPETNGFFGGFLAGRVERRVLTFSGTQPSWRSWLVSPEGAVSEGPRYPTTLGGLRVSATLDVAIGIRQNEATKVRELEIWR